MIVYGKRTRLFIAYVALAGLFLGARHLDDANPIGALSIISVIISSLLFGALVRIKEEKE